MLCLAPADLKADGHAITAKQAAAKRTTRKSLGAFEKANGEKANGVETWFRGMTTPLSNFCGLTGAITIGAGYGFAVEEFLS
jgi:hypothetical protein